MNTIINYLENMFMNLPDTDEVRRAKTELLNMMEDKYNELISEGKTDNEAVGMVIAGFGNLDELAEELGIRNIVDDKELLKEKYVNKDIASKFIELSVNSANKIAIGVSMCILSPILLILLSGITEYMGLLSETMAAGIGVSVLLILVAIAVGLFIYSALPLKEYEYLKSETFELTPEAQIVVDEYDNKYKAPFTGKIIAGVVLCIMAAIPVVLTGVMSEESGNEFPMIIAVSVMLAIVSIAAHLFVTAGIKKGTADILLQREDFSKDVKSDKVMKTIASVYWMVMTAAYLLVSFLTRRWDMTWIIWPVAGVLFGVISVVRSAIKNK